jgi:hypothetical protein
MALKIIKLQNFDFLELIFNCYSESESDFEKSIISKTISIALTSSIEVHALICA